MMRRRLRLWLEETHSPQFELARHFFHQFFESEFVATPGQLKVLAAGALSVLASLCIIFLQAYYAKYRALKALDVLEPFYLAVLSDVLFLISLTMLVAALFTTWQWPSLFPGLRDYLALAALPVKMRQIFTAKFAALLAFAAAFIFAIVVPPSVALPFAMAGPRVGQMTEQVPGILVSCAGAGFFVFFSLVALQGVLLNVLPVRLFQRFSLAIQAALLALLMCALPLVISIPRLAGSMAERPGWAVWAPPLWFLGVDQVIFGNGEPLARELAWRAIVAVALSALAAALVYAWSYQRQRVRVLESPGGEQRIPRAWPTRLAERLLPEPRTLASFAFIAKTMARSRQHRLILTGFVGLALALIVEGFAGLLLRGDLLDFQVQSAALRPVAIAIPLSLSLFTLAGFRYLFRLPVELRSNWMFRIHEPGNAPELLAGAERFLQWAAVIPVAVLTLPVEVYLLGPGAGVTTALLALAPSLCLVEVLLLPFGRIPFTSSYLPGRRPMFEVVLGYGVAVTLYVSLVSTLLAWCADDALRTVAALALFTLAWRKLRSTRIEMQQSLQLEFEELEEPVVQTLSIDRD